MVSNCASLGAQSRELTATANLSKGGDSIHYDFITATVPQSSSFSEQLWDFSNSKYLGQEKEVFFVGNDSNHIKMIGKDAILDFSQDKEHLLLKRLQAPLLNIDFGNSFEYLKFPFPLNDSLTCQIEGKGTYCSKNKLVLSGTCCTKTMAKGKYQFEGGYCSFDNNLNPTYHYYEKDHLGSIRMVVNENGTIEQVNHYYPFGGVYGDLGYNSELQRNKYIGKEFDHTSGLDWYDHGARMYDAAKGSWDRVDKLAEKYNSINPYVYSINNPIKNLDLDGLKPRIYIETNGLGHTFVTIGEGRNTIVYTYGRYGALGSSGSILHQFTPTGEGVLIRRTGKQAINYIQKKLEDGNLSIYTLEKGSDKDVASFFDRMWNCGTRPTNNKKNSKNDSDAKVVDKYSIFKNNCTTKAIEGVNYKQKKPIIPAEVITTMYDLGGSYDYKDKIISPSTLKRQLDESSKKHPKDIVKVKNPNEFVNNLQKKYK